MNESIPIKKNDFVKYMKSIYLVKDFQKLENGRYRLNYYFRSLEKNHAKLHLNGHNNIIGYLAKNIRKATTEEMNF